VPHSKGRKRSWRHPIAGSEQFFYEKVTWQQAAHIVTSLAWIIENEYGVKPNDRVGIISWNRAEWMWMALATWSAGGIVVGIDPRLESDVASYILGQAHRSPETLTGSALKVVFCEDAAQAAKVQVTAPGAADIKIAQLCDVIADARENLERRYLASESSLTHDQLAMLVATSGSTGNPKLVMITHGNLAHMSAAVPERIALRSDDIYFGLLPANHIFAWNGQGPALWSGVTMFLCHPLDLKKHIKRVRPTVLLGVTKLWLMLVDELQAPPSHKLLARLKSGALARAFNPEASTFNRLLNLVVSKVLNFELGGRLRIRVTGGAAFPSILARKLEVLGQKVDPGYGLSETTGAATVGYIGREVPGSSGASLLGVTLSFKPLEDDDGTEIVVGGPTISPGYWGQPELTAQAFIAGAFHTGDVGHLEDGCLVVEGRVGEDGKLLNGEKVSSAEIVAEFTGNRLIQFVVPEFIGRPFVTALIYLNEANARALVAEKTGTSEGLSLKDLAGSAVILGAVQAEIDRANERIGLKGQWKRIRKIAIVPTTPTIENRQLSGKGEISAKVAKKSEAGLIAGLYR
jgi:long-chain acyl-CoA synthetase